jgi:small subunit ribosomal protein S9
MDDKKSFIKKPAIRLFQKKIPRKNEDKKTSDENVIEEDNLEDGDTRIFNEAGDESGMETASQDLDSSGIKIEKISDVQIKILKENGGEESSTDLSGRTYATGKRKNAVAKVWLQKGGGNIVVNNLQVLEYFRRPILEVMINTPFAVTNTQNKFDVICSVRGGGLSGQAGALRHAIAKAMLAHNSEAYGTELKSSGLLTRDSRVVERKKPGLKKARKGQVFSKR